MCCLPPGGPAFLAQGGSPVRRLAIVLVCLFAGPLAAAEPKPLQRAHAHNDYEHDRPLLDALDCGFCSVEADVHLINGQLRVAHDSIRALLAGTLEDLYLDPLAQRVKENGGRVYRGGPAFTLLIDIKTEPKATYAKVRQVLQLYAPML